MWWSREPEKVCTLCSALKHTIHLLISPGYTWLTITILFHSNLFLDATQKTQPFPSFLAIINNISRLRRVSSVEWFLVLAGTHSKPPLQLSCTQQLDPICAHGFLDPTLICFSSHESMALLLGMNLISVSLFQKF